MMDSMSSKQLTIAVDFDGVIADYEGWEGEGHIGQQRKDVIEALAQLRKEGWRIIVYSCRAATDIRAYLVANGVPFDEINTNSARATKGPKPSATVYWDDRAVRYSGNALADIKEIRDFRTWNGRR